MRRDDYFLLIASGLLKLNTDALTPALEHFGQFYQLDEPGKVGTVSLAGTHNGQLTAFREWITKVRESNITKVACSWASYASHHDLEPHIAAAFAGSQMLTLAITVDSRIDTYLLRGEFSPQHEMTAEQFAIVVNSHKDKDRLWLRISDLVEEHLKLNNKATFEKGMVSTYLIGNGRSEFDFLSSTLIQEVQVECEVNNHPFTFPHRLKHLFYKSDFPPFEERRIVFLNPIANPTAADLIDLVNAQTVKGQVWDKLISKLEEFPIEGLSLRTENFPECLLKMTSEELVAISSTLCRAIAELCEEAGIDRIIPNELKDLFGPDDLENQRAHARIRAGKNQWYLAQNENPWEMYVFEQVDDLELSVPSSLIQARDKFKNCLVEIGDFAQRVQSTFEEAFRLGIFFLTDENQRGDFGESHQVALLHKLEREHFSPQALEHFKQVMSYTPHMQVLQFSSGKMADVFAISVADVFGGMGSWNDQYFAEEHQETYERVSANLFESLKQFFSCALSE